MCSPQIAQGFQIAGGIAGASAEREAGRTQQSINQANASNLEIRAGEAIESGKLDVRRQNIKTARLKGQQKVSFAGSGVSVQSGSALDILSDTAALGALDADIIRIRSERQAEALRFQAGQERISGRLARSRGRSRGISTLLTTAGSISRGYKRPSGGTTVPGDAYQPARQAGYL